MPFGDGLETVTEYEVRRWVGAVHRVWVLCVLDAKHYRKELHDELLAVLCAIIKLKFV